jgi:2-dehydropantoate 2-reductase
VNGKSPLARSRHKPSARDELDRRIYVLGIGNLGRLFASALSSLPDRPPVTLVVHKKQLLETWLSADHPGIEITRGQTVERFRDFDIEWWTEERPDFGPQEEIANGERLRNLIVLTKAPDAIPQIDKIRRYLDKQSVVLFVQNGMCKLWPPHGQVYNSSRFAFSGGGGPPSWLACVTTHGVTSLGDFKSLHASPADAVLGPVALNDSNLRQVAYITKQLTSAPYLGARAVTRSELWVLQLEKLVLNAVINPLTAILRCKNGSLFSEADGPIVDIMSRLLREASSVLQALIRHESSNEILNSDPPNPADLQSGEGGTLNKELLLDRFSETALKAMVYRVGERVRDNKSSMLQDVLAGKTTEIREFNGWLVDTADYLGGLDVTNHRTMINLVESNVVCDSVTLGRYFS